MMIKNYYYFVVGLLSILFAITHALNGQAVILPSLEIELISIEIKTIFFYVWHIISAENILFGITFLIMAFYKKQGKVRFTAFVIAGLMVLRWIVIFYGTFMYNRSGLGNITIDTIAIIIFTALILLGTRVKDKIKS